jgi:hypothetical protein
MNTDVQAWAAAGVVVVTIVAFVRRALKRKKHGGCNTCGGGSGTLPKP